MNRMDQFISGAILQVLVNRFRMNGNDQNLGTYQLGFAFPFYGNNFRP